MTFYSTVDYTNVSFSTVDALIFRQKKRDDTFFVYGERARLQSYYVKNINILLTVASLTLEERLFDTPWGNEQLVLMSRMVPDSKETLTFADGPHSHIKVTPRKMKSLTHHYPKTEKG